MMPSARAGTAGLVVAATSTGISVCISTFSVCEPSIMPRLLRRPCDAMKIRSQPALRAMERIASYGWSLITLAALQGTPCARAADSALAEQLARAPLEGVGDIARRRRPDHLGLAAQRRSVIGDGMKERYARTDRASEFDRLPDDLGRKVGSRR